MVEKKKSGRPPALKPDAKTLKQVMGLGQIQATTKECAAVLGVSEPTFIKFKADHPIVAETLDAGRETGKASLRRMQFDAAKKGNPTMLIWLGKQMLGQRDRKEHSGPNGGPIPTMQLDPEQLKGMSDEEIAALESVLGKLGGSLGDGPGGEGQEGD